MPFPQIWFQLHGRCVHDGGVTFQPSGESEDTAVSLTEAHGQGSRRHGAGDEPWLAGRPAWVYGPQPSMCILLLFYISEKPLMNVLHHGHQPVVVDALAIDGRHRIVGVPHYGVDRYLVAGVAGHRLESVP